MPASMAARSRSPPRWMASRAIPRTSRCRSSWCKRKFATWAKTASASVPWSSAPSAAKRAKATPSRPTAREPSMPPSICRPSARTSGSNSTSTRRKAIAANRSSLPPRKTRSTAPIWPWWFSCRTIEPGTCCKPVTSISARPLAPTPLRKPTNNAQAAYDGDNGRIADGGPGGPRRLETAKRARGARESRRPIQREVAGRGAGRLAFLLVEAHGGGAHPHAHLDRRRPAVLAGRRRAVAGPAGDAGSKFRHGSGILRRRGGVHAAGARRPRRAPGRAETGGERLVSILQQQTVPAAEDGQGGTADHNWEVVRDFLHYLIDIYVLQSRPLHQRQHHRVQLFVGPRAQLHIAVRRPALGVRYTRSGSKRGQRTQRLQFQDVRVGKRLERAAEIRVSCWSGHRLVPLHEQFAVEQVGAPGVPVVGAQLLRVGVVRVLTQHQVLARQPPARIVEMGK